MSFLIETDRFLIREFLPSDENGLFTLDSDPNVHRYLGNNPVVSMEQIKTVIQNIRQQYVDHGIGRWAIIDKQTNEFVGWTGLKYETKTINRHTNYYDLGYRLRTPFWGKGIATETAKASVAYAFECLNLSEIYGMCDANNLNSKKVLEKSGLTCLEAFDLDGTEHFWFRVTRQDWEQTSLK